METQRERTAPPPSQSTEHKPLKIMYTNARSIVNKIQELKLLAADCSPDVIAVTESWTHCAISNSNVLQKSKLDGSCHNTKSTSLTGSFHSNLFEMVLNNRKVHAVYKP